MPDTALVFDIAELQNSEMPGLDKAEITPHTLQANASDIELSLKAALRPTITLGLQLGIVEISAGPYMDLPSFNLTTKQLATDNIGANCETDGDTDVKFKDAFQNLTSVDFSVGVEAGFIANFEALLASYEPSVSLVGAAVPVATQCLVWQDEGDTKKFVPATAVLASLTSPSPSGDGRKDSGGAMLRTPLTGILYPVDSSIFILAIIACAIGSLGLIL